MMWGYINLAVQIATLIALVILFRLIRRKL